MTNLSRSCRRSTCFSSCTICSVRQTKCWHVSAGSNSFFVANKSILKKSVNLKLYILDLPPPQDSNGKGWFGLGFLILKMYKNPSGDRHPGWGRSNLYGKDPEKFMAYELLSILKFAVMVSPALIKTKSLTPVFQLATALFLLIHGLFATIAHIWGKRIPWSQKAPQLRCADMCAPGFFGIRIAVNFAHFQTRTTYKVGPYYIPWN